uniref:Inositol-pentakisphosphate 2-kinase n=1 Tax=Monopterus albus TaxID=43700 RepID=A0A3Q3KSG3_MONAL
MELDKMDENDWKYHGEGNKSLVVSHIQVSQLVLRLLKYPAEDSENPPQTAEQAFRQIQNIVDFSSNVMSSLLGEKFIHSGEVVKLPLEFVRQLSIKVQHQRPVWRCDKVMDIYSGCALCLPNLTSPPLHQPTHTPPLCIEIKVRLIMALFKCLFFLFSNVTVALALFQGRGGKHSVLIKNMQKDHFLNLSGGQCIYSSKEGGDDSMDLNSLLNNLRPYLQSGNNRINNHMSSKPVLNDFIQVLANALLSEGGDGGVVMDRQEEGRSFCEASVFNKERIHHGAQGLPSDSVLFRILQTQMLDTLDIEGLYPLYRRVEQHLQDFPKERTRLQIDGPYNEAFLEKLQKCPSEDDGSVEYAAAKVHQYRVSMTAKDCSIMVALVPRNEEEEDFLSSRPPAFSYSVSILDLDPKPFDSIPRQLRLDQKIVSCYLRTGGALPKGSLPPLPGIFTAGENEDCRLLFHPV